MMRLAPRPDVSYILDADPVQARARKPEYPLDFIHLNRQAYLDLASLLGGFTIVPPGPVADVHANILSHLPETEGVPACPIRGSGNEMRAPPGPCGRRRFAVHLTQVGILPAAQVKTCFFDPAFAFSLRC